MADLADRIMTQLGGGGDTGSNAPPPAQAPSQTPAPPPPSPTEPGSPFHGQGAYGNVPQTPPQQPAQVPWQQPQAPQAPGQPPPGQYPGQQAPAPTQPQQPGGMVPLTDALRQYGVQGIQQGWNDTQALQFLIQQARANEEAKRLAQYGSEYLQNRDSYQQWLAQQKATLAQQQQVQQKWWNPPEWNPDWRRFLYRDEQGVLRAHAESPPGVLEKYRQAQEWQTRQMEQFMFGNPVEAMKPGLVELIRAEAQQMIQNQTSQQQEVQFSQGFLRENANWILETANGQPVRDPGTGSYRMSEWGQLFKGYVDQLQQQGIRGDQLLATLAKGYVERDYAQRQLQQMQAPGQAQNQGEQQKQQFLQQAQQGQYQQQQAPGFNGGGYLPQTQAPGFGQQQPGQAQNPHISLQERLAQRFAAAGITDQAVRTSLFNGAR